MKKKPDNRGYYEIFGGRYVPEILMPALEELTKEYKNFSKDKSFTGELAELYKNFAGRPTPLYHAAEFSRAIGGPVIFLKREDLNHTGSHKLNNTLGQALLTKKMGKKRIIAETGAGQHGVATATAAALFNLECKIYMGSKDVERQNLNVLRMKLLGAEVIPVETGHKTLKDAINETIRDWVTNVSTTHYLLGSVVGPHPYPMIVRDFQSIIGNEVKNQIKKITGKKFPDAIIACVGGGSNAMGIFYPFIKEKKVRLIGVEAAGTGLNKLHSATLSAGKPGVLHGSYSYLLQNRDGQIKEVHSIAPGLDYPGVGPEHSFLKRTGRAEYYSATDKEVTEVFKLLARTEGIIPALESSHALAYIKKHAKKFKKNEIIVICLSGRGDKDIGTIIKG